MAYFIKQNTTSVALSYLPFNETTKSGRAVMIERYNRETDEVALHEILRHIVEDEGNSYPQETMTMDEFRAYYVASPDVFVCKDEQTSEVLGGFYVKPNYPDRSKHIANGGFIVKLTARGDGIGRIMTKLYLRIARDLGYTASLFNLVFVTNKTSCSLYRDLGFKEIGLIPSAGNLNGHGFTDAIVFYYDLSTLPNEN